jgi:dihydroflavonol-4-reductase
MDFASAAVTGATGHLGNVLVRELTARGKKVRALVVGNDDRRPLEGSGAEVAVADVTEASSLVSAFAGVDVVFHLAGIVSISSGARERMRLVNVEGTRNVTLACKAAQVKRLVYTGSVHGLTEPTPGGVLDETAGFDPALAVGDYGRSKAAASKVVLEAVQGGLDAVLVLPAGVTGPRDYRLSEMGEMVRMFGQGTMKAAIAGGYDFVDVRDVALGHVLACERGRRGESYILNGEHLTVKRALAVLADATGLRAPRFVLPLWLARVLAAAAPLYELATGRRSLLTSYSVHTLSIDFTISDAKARAELGFAPRPIEQSLRDAWQWMRDDPDSPLKSRALVRPGRVLAAKPHGPG